MRMSVDAKTPFVVAKPLPDLSKVALPKMTELHEFPREDNKMVSVRWKGLVERPNGRNPEHAQLTATSNAPVWFGTGWYEVKGSLQDAAKAAQHLAQFQDDPWYAKNNQRAVTSASVVQAAEGRYYVSRNQFMDPPNDDMAAYVSMPIDPIRQGDSDISYPYGGDFTPTKIAVRFNDPHVVAVVGRDNWAVAPQH